MVTISHSYIRLEIVLSIFNCFLRGSLAQLVSQPAQPSPGFESRLGTPIVGTLRGVSDPTM